MKILRKMRGITLISLIVTIIILLILAGISIQLIGGSNGILNRASQVLDVNDKATATEKMELKITYLNMVSYGENTRKATLQELADGLFADKEVEYVKLKNQEVASLEPIDVTGENSFFVKLKEYSYEFEIDENLQLSSVDGVKIATTNDNYVLKAEFEELKKKMAISEIETEQLKKEVENLSTEMSLLQNNNTNKIKLINRGFGDGNVTIATNGWTTLESVSLAGNGSGKAIISYSASSGTGNSTRFAIQIGTPGTQGLDAEMNTGESEMYVSTSACIDYNESTKVLFQAHARKTFVPRYCYSILLIPVE